MSGLLNPHEANAQDLFKSFLRPKSRVKSVIVLSMVGGPSQLETFEYKPELNKSHGKTISGFADFLGNEGGVIQKHWVPFKQYGQSGKWVSDLLPNIATLSDELTFIHSLNASSKLHTAAQLEFNTGSIFEGNPFSGAWINYGLNRAQKNLPNMVIMSDPKGPPRAGDRTWQSGNLPNGNSKIFMGHPGLFAEELKQLRYSAPSEHQNFLNLLKETNKLGKLKGTLFNKRESEFQNIFDIKDEMLKAVDLKISDEEVKLYGVHNQNAAAFAKQLLVARNLIEKNVPFIQINCGNLEDENSWDNHFNMADIKMMTNKIDRPIYGFITDLKRRGLLDDVIILWGGEFGKLPVYDKREPNSTGRSHNDGANTIFMAGGGLKKGFSYGVTDEISLNTVQDKVEIGDIWATILHLMGINHEELNYENNLAKHRFTKKGSRVIKEILA